MHADLILIDERKGSHVALNKGFEVAGTLGVLALAARRGLVDLADSFDRLKRTNFRYRQEVMDVLLDQQGAWLSPSRSLFGMPEKNTGTRRVNHDR